jgi:hypothetical protein
MIINHLILAVTPPPLLQLTTLHRHHQQPPISCFLPPPTTGRSLPPAAATTTVILHCCCCCCCPCPCVQQGCTVCPVDSWSDGTECCGMTAEDVLGMLCLVFLSSLFLLLFCAHQILFNSLCQWTLLFLSPYYSHFSLLSFPITTSPPPPPPN